MAEDAFLKFDGVQGEAVDGKLHQEFRAIGTDFGNLGGDFVKLIDDVSSEHGASFLKIAHDLQVDHDVLKIDSDFLRIGDGFLKLDTEFLKFGDGFSNFVEQQLKITLPSVGDDGSSPLLDAFHKIDSDFHNTGGDFIKLGADFIKLNEPDSGDLRQNVFQVGDDFLKIDSDLQNASDHFIALGTDILKIGELSDLKVVDQVFHQFGDDLLKVGDKPEYGEPGLSPNRPGFQPAWRHVGRDQA
jgi:hypothetical protein